ncbi:Ras family protein [Colletotrichum acutatum]
MPAPKNRKVAIVGSRSVGKSSLAVQFVDGHFVDSYYPTIENTFSKTIRYKGQEFATEIVDTAGQGTESVPIVIVGNKSDLRPEQRQVSAEEGKRVAEKIQCGWTEASARYNENVGKAFDILIAEIEKAQNPGETAEGGKCILM